MKHLKRNKFWLAVLCQTKMRYEYAGNYLLLKLSTKEQAPVLFV
jgi:hypothetical protein